MRLGSVVCDENELVTTINWNDDRWFSIHEYGWLPGTLRSIDITEKNSCSSMQIRWLPHGMEFCRIQACRTLGTLEFDALPVKMREIHLVANRFHAEVNLTNLPVTIEIIDLSSNILDTVYVINGLLPRGLKDVYLYQPQKNLRILCLDEDKVDKRVCKKKV